MNGIVALKQRDGSFLIGMDVKNHFELKQYTELESFDDFIHKNNSAYIFTLLSYQLGFPILDLKSKATDKLFPLISAWTFNYVYTFKDNVIKQLNGAYNPASEIRIRALFENNPEVINELHFESNLTQAAYFDKIEQIKTHLQQGNIYELNFCQSFSSEYTEPLNTSALFNKLYRNNPVPHAAFIDFPTWSLASASPERFIQKRGNRVSSDPIKGTARRGETKEEDERIKKQLKESIKERAENVMIVDLVRNDLSKIAAKGSVEVNELYGIYTYPTVHQMISSISCTLNENTPFTAQLRALFPMGSMTGAPKRSAVAIAQELENFNREIYSGSFGVIYPNGDYDFNVLIRTLEINKTEQTISCAVGGAITILSYAEAEYEECQTKIGKIISLFGTCTWS